MQLVSEEPVCELVFMATPMRNCAARLSYRCTCQHASIFLHACVPDDAMRLLHPDADDAMLPLPCACRPLSFRRSMCLGLPYVAWLAALQRQRVVAKHGVAVTEEDAWATACYPCSLLQMHALLQQQQHSSNPRRQHQQPSVPLRAPVVQQMTGGRAWW